MDFLLIRDVMWSEDQVVEKIKESRLKSLKIEYELKSWDDILKIASIYSDHSGTTSWKQCEKISCYKNTDLGIWYLGEPNFLEENVPVTNIASITKMPVTQIIFRSTVGIRYYSYAVKMSTGKLTKSACKR